MQIIFENIAVAAIGAAVGGVLGMGVFLAVLYYL